MVAGQKRKQPESLTLELVKAGISEKVGALTMRFWIPSELANQVPC